MSEVPAAEATMLAAYSEVRYSLAKTGLNDMPPVRLSTCNGAFYFQDYLSGDEARELADALRSIADTVDPAPDDAGPICPVDATDFYAATDTTVAEAWQMVSCATVAEAWQMVSDTTVAEAWQMVSCAIAAHNKDARFGGWRDAAIGAVAGRLGVRRDALARLLREYEGETARPDPPSPAALRQAFGAAFVGDTAVIPKRAKS